MEATSKLNIKAIVLDMDGTLLNDKKEITPKTKEALIQAQGQGIKVILASGRPLNAMNEFAKQLAMDHHHGLLIGYNGACVSDTQDFSILYESPIPHDKVVRLLDHLKQFDATPLIVQDDKLHISRHDKPILKIDEKTTFNVIEYEVGGGNFNLVKHDRLQDSLTGKIHKVLASMDYDVLRNNLEALTKPFDKELNAVISFACYLEYTNIGVDKAHTLAIVLEQLQIHPDEVLVFGDSFNDITMMELSKYPVAMANAVQQAKEVAWKIADSNNEDGIAKILNRYLL